MLLKALSFRWNANPKSWPFVTPKDPLALFTRAEVWALVSWPNSRWVIKFCLPKIPPVVSAEYSILHFLSKTAVQNCFVLVNSCHISPQRNCCISVLLSLSLSLSLTYDRGLPRSTHEHPFSLVGLEAESVQGTARQALSLQSSPGPHSPLLLQY